MKEKFIIMNGWIKYILLGDVPNFLGGMRGVLRPNPN